MRNDSGALEAQGCSKLTLRSIHSFITVMGQFARVGSCWPTLWHRLREGLLVKTFLGVPVGYECPDKPTKTRNVPHEIKHFLSFFSIHRIGVHPVLILIG